MALCPAARADLVEETGSLRGFVAGQEPAAAYDNWQSHVSERIARPGYNVYAPPLLDPQLNGFGQYTPVPSGAEGDELLAGFRQLFTHLLWNEPGPADTLLASLAIPALELVRFQDLDSGHELLILRERLDSTFVDPGLSPLPHDDVVGGFALGWGLFVFDPSAARPEIIVQAPHPCDDYITPVISLEVFQELGAGVLMIAGAGREVLFSGSTFNNSVSLSDPSRNCRHVFNEAHKAAVDAWQAQGVEELVLQIHSYDDVPHRNLKSCVVSGGPWTRLALPPLYDSGGNGLGALDRLLQPALPTDALGFPHPELLLQDYASHGALLALDVSGGLPDSTISLPVSSTLLGYNDNCQMEYSFGHHGIGYAECDRPERLLHIELDELPAPAHAMGESVFHAADSTRVADWTSFGRAWTCYRPLFTAIGEARDARLAFAGGDPPTTPQAFSVLDRGADKVRLKWRPTVSSEHYSYEILLDSTGTLGPESRLVDRAEVTNLCWAPLTSAWITNLAGYVPWTAAIRAVDRQGRPSAWSSPVTFTLVEQDPPLVQVLPGARDCLWTRNDSLEIRVRLVDAAHLVNLASLQVRLDHNLDGVYSGSAENWVGAGLAGAVADTTLLLQRVFTDSGPRMRFELRALDNQTVLWGYSGRQGLAGIGDDYFGVLDTLPPAPFPSDLSVQPTAVAGELLIRWGSQPVDTTEAGTRLLVADHFFSEPGEAQLVLDALSHPALGDPLVDSLVVSGLPFPAGTLWWMADRVDHAGNQGPPAGPLEAHYDGASGCRVADLVISLENGGLRLQWQTLCHGGIPEAAAWRVYRRTGPGPYDGPPELLLETGEPTAWLPLENANRGFYHVTALFLP
jgi:hypothetical protein